LLRYLTYLALSNSRSNKLGMHMRICQLFVSCVISIQNASFPNLITEGGPFILLKVQFQYIKVSVNYTVFKVTGSVKWSICVPLYRSYLASCAKLSTKRIRTYKIVHTVDNARSLMIYIFVLSRQLKKKKKNTVRGLIIPPYIFHFRQVVVF